MFSKKKCPRCSRKIEKDYEFCPYCGKDFRAERRFQKQKDFGLLGEDDILTPNLNIGMPLGFGNLFQSLLKEVDKQFHELDKEIAKERLSETEFTKLKEQSEKGKFPGSGISISISSMNNGKPEIRVKSFGPDFKDISSSSQAKAKIHKSELTDEDAKKLSKLPRREAEARVRRLSNKLVYELELPGVKDLKNVIINKLENSTEVKAFSNNTAYFKLLPIKLKLLNYKLKDSKLILEFSSQ